MDVTTRLQIRARAQSYAERAKPGLTTNDEGSGNESASESVARRKFQRTAAEQQATDTPSTFRKPSFPASATRQAPMQVTGGSAPARTAHQRRRSTLRENTRVPSGPREYPSPRKSVDTSAPADSDNPPVRARPQHRSFLPQHAAKPPDASRFSFGNHSSNDADSPVTPAEVGNFDFLPPVNFDDFQTSLATYEGGTSPLLSEFPTHSGGRALPKEDDNSARSSEGSSGASASSMAGTNGYTSQQARRMQQRQELDQQNLTRGQNFRRRISAITNDTRQASQSSVTTLGSLPPKSASIPAGSSGSGQQNSLDSTSTVKRPGNAQQMATNFSSTQYVGAPGMVHQKPPRKSVGPGLVTSLYETPRRATGSSASQEAAQQQRTVGPIRTLSTSSKPRRSTIQPSNSANAIDLPRISTLSATTQSRQAKVKSYAAPSKEEVESPQSTQTVRPTSKGNLRATTPNSSGNKRQSIVSGRASGLGARTISPTDARRLKRMSMMNAVPMPSLPPNVNPGSTPLDDLPPSLQGARLPYPDMPRQKVPSPSLIPRKASHTPSSARASPDSGSGISLSSKSSYSSLLAASSSTSRLPTPKTRNLHSAASASFGGESLEDDEIVPPVPAIPKAYESPKDLLCNAPPRKGSSGSWNKAQPSDEVIWNEQNRKTPATDPDASLFPASLLGFDDGSGTWKGSPRSVKTSQQKQPTDSTVRYRQLSTSHRRTATSGNAKVTADDLTAAFNNANANANASEPVAAAVAAARKKNANLQPLRLPPLNLKTNELGQQKAHASNDSASGMVDMTKNLAQTPEPKRAPKTPSTPMTASKATFFKRSNTDNPGYIRSSSSHYALRDALANTFGDDATKWFDESDAETGSHTNYSMGVHVPKNQGQHRGITPFSSGSLPKGSGEFARNGLKGRPSREDSSDEYSLGKFDNVKVQKAKPLGIQTAGTRKQTESEASSPVVSNGEGGAKDAKKESSGLRRKLSMSWRRSSSKAASHADHQDEGGNTLKEKRSKDAMPPPKLPASATWSGEIPQLPSSARRSFEQATSSRRKSSAAGLLSLSLLGGGDQQQQAIPQKPTKLHSEQPQPAPPTNRSTSWGSFSLHGNRHINVRQQKPRQPDATPSISALTKDKDDTAADDEMRRLSQKRRDVDAAARESEALWARAVPRIPINPEQVLVDPTAGLNIFERGEVVDYQKDGKIIGSVGSSSDKSGDRSNNFGYDDERGDYNIILGDHLAYRYEVVDVEGGVVAVKIIRNKKRFHQQALVEVGILNKLRDWDPDGEHATLSITSSFYFRNHLCIVTPCLGMNLYELIRAHNFTGFSIPLIRRFARQMVACLTLLQQRRIIHCDLKPENILICDPRKADVRVIDFGSSCKEEEKVYTYIQSRFYRSPEVILGSNYGLGIDMWSFGCILAELWTGYPIFPGENEQEQLACIMEIFGPPDKKITDLCTRKKVFFDSLGKPRVTVSSKGRRRRPSSKTLQQSLKTDDEAFIDFIAKCLRWDPDRRLKPNEAVSHPFILNTSMKQLRQGIPDEARRAARLRPTATVPAPVAAAHTAMPSPVKRTVQRTATDTSNAFAHQQQAAAALQSTPARQKREQAPEAPQTKPTVASMNRRLSTLASAGGASAMAGNKRASNGAALGNLLNGAPNGAPSNIASSRQASGKANHADLAQMAAVQSMSATNAASKWRT
ncbi:hypothetical protein K431DRAFT_319676 [Polychaeton citri CBS 116435]|uniref:Protein kinase domain-containing protein n=1 Tax=Polychaeton citri CBS 116435 TaxID=1314669 RepID=A0A9P4Q8F3_9PEZI|nr:hypothetical protein K431DRAFT_319676 [Polychaeton citri CBS 116435]